MTPVRKRLSATLAAIFALSLVTIPPPAEARGGKAKTSVGHAGANRPPPGRGGTADRRPARQPPKARPGGGTNRPPPGGRPNNRPNNNRPPNRGHNNIHGGNTVVVNNNVDRGYHHGYYDHDWDDDWHHHDGFWDDVGEAALATAAVVGTAAVIGEIVDDEPDNCQQSVHYGMTYLYCNGVWYQPTYSGSNTQYVVVQQPQ